MGLIKHPSGVEVKESAELLPLFAFIADYRVNFIFYLHCQGSEGSEMLSVQKYRATSVHFLIGLHGEVFC